MARDLSMEIYHQFIQDFIFAQETPEGMITEQFLAEKYKVSKTPTREALVRLISDGLLIKYPCKGYALSNLSGKALQEINQTRYYLEVSAAEISISGKTYSMEQIDALRKEYQKGEYVDMHTLLLNNYHFHTDLASLCGNQFLLQTLDSILIRLMQPMKGKTDLPSILKMINENFEESHKKILDAFSRYDLEDARKQIYLDMFAG